MICSKCQQFISYLTVLTVGEWYFYFCQAEHDAAQQLVTKQQTEIISLSGTISGQVQTISEHEQQVNVAFQYFKCCVFCNVLDQWSLTVAALVT